MVKVERLSPKDTEEALFVLNYSFQHNGIPADFKVNMPIMWSGEKDYM